MQAASHVLILLVRALRQHADFAVRGPTGPIDRDALAVREAIVRQSGMACHRHEERRVRAKHGTVRANRF